MTAMDRARADVRAQDRRDRLDRHVAKIVDHAEAMGWAAITESIPVDDPDVEHATAIGAIKVDEHPDDPSDRVEWVFTTAVAVRKSSGRVITLQQTERDNAGVTIEPEGFNRYWRGGATSWSRALADAQAWTDWWPTPEEQRAARIGARIREAVQR
jgi:hypothetical protein